MGKIGVPMVMKPDRKGECRNDRINRKLRKKVSQRSLLPAKAFIMSRSAQELKLRVIYNILQLFFSAIYLNGSGFGTPRCRKRIYLLIILSK